MFAGFRFAGFRISTIVASILLSTITLAADKSVPPAPDLDVKGYILLDAHTGHVIAEKNADERLEPASLTKMMTAYVTEYEIQKGNISPDDITTVSENAWAKKLSGSSLMFLQVGTQVSVRDLLKGVIISSGNDATVALAEHIAGSSTLFANMMNEHATRMGLKGTHFVNPHGLPDPDHYTTARDMSVLARAIILDFPEQYKTYAEKTFTYNNIEQPNRNRLLWSDSSVDGLKTGHTAAAGYCLVASAKHDDMRLVSVVMGAKTEPGRINETRKLLDYGFRFYQTLKAFSKGDKIAEERVWAGKSDKVTLEINDDVYVTIPRSQAGSVKTEQTINQYIEAPIKAGDKLGEVTITFANGMVFKKDLVAKESIDEAGFFMRIWEKIHLFIFKLMSA